MFRFKSFKYEDRARDMHTLLWDDKSFSLYVKFKHIRQEVFKRCLNAINHLNFRYHRKLTSVKPLMFSCRYPFSSKLKKTTTKYVTLKTWNYFPEEQHFSTTQCLFF